MAFRNPNRLSAFSHIHIEAQKVHPALQGYENEPLVCLEDAVRPLVGHVPEIERMVQLVKETCEAPKHGLTHDESSSILLYSMEWQPNKSFSYFLNTTLQRTDLPILRHWFPYIRLLMTALNKLPSLSERQKVYRGLKIDFSAKIKQGQTIVWWAFSSCTMSANVAKGDRFLGNHDKRTMFTIDCYSGKNIQDHTLYPDEKEVLLLPGSQFEAKLCRYNRVDGLFEVHLREIGPECITIDNAQSLANNSSKLILSTLLPLGQQQQQRIFLNATQISAIAASQRETSAPILTHRVSTTAAAKSMLSSTRSSTNTAQLATEHPERIAPQSSASICRTVQRSTSTPVNIEHSKNLSEQTQILYIDPVRSELDLRDRCIGEREVRNIATSLAGNQTLKTLSLWYNCINAQGAMYLADALKDNRTLTTLHLSYNSIRPQGVEYIADLLRQNKTLAILYLSYNQIHDEGAEFLADALKENTSLKVLNLYRNEIGSSGAECLARALETNKKLETLNIGDNEIDDVGVKHLARALQSNRTLKTLNLNNNMCGNAGAQYLARTLENYRTLKHLYIRNNKFNQETKKLFEKLREKHIRFQIFY